MTIITKNTKNKIIKYKRTDGVCFLYNTVDSKLKKTWIKGRFPEEVVRIS